MQFNVKSVIRSVITEQNRGDSFFLLDILTPSKLWSYFFKSSVLFPTITALEKDFENLRFLRRALEDEYLEKYIFIYRV